MPLRHCLGSIPFLWIALAAAGCGSGRTALAPVKGSVTLDGKPLASGTITFEATGKRPATGRIVQGEIVEMTTYESGDGAPLGTHKVAVWASEEAAAAVVPNPGEEKIGANYMSGKSLIPALYNDPNTSGLVAEIKSGQNKVDFQLFMKTKK